MFGRSTRVARLFGIDVRVDLSWLVIVALIGVSLWSRFGTGALAYAPATAILMAAAGTVLFFASLLAHELAHALEARRRGVGVGSITLYVFGGATATTTEARRPSDEFALTAVGPGTSLLLAAAFAAASWGAQILGLAAVAAVVGLLGWINLALGLFNLLPGAPLDGGRLLDSIVWRVTGDRAKARRVSTATGQVLGGTLVAAGLFEILFLVGGLVGGLWLAFIGWFLYGAARAEQLHGDVLEALAGRTAGDLLPPVAPVDPTTRVSWIAATALGREHAGAVTVADGGEVVGVVTADDVRSVPPGARFEATAREVMHSAAAYPSVPASTDAASVFPLLVEHGLLVVHDGDRVIGALARDDVVGRLRATRPRADARR